MGADHGTWQDTSVSDYERIAKAIHYLDTHYVEQPDLTELARRTGVSVFHFHRLFSKWAGVTPT